MKIWKENGLTSPSCSSKNQENNISDLRINAEKNGTTTWIRQFCTPSGLPRRITSFSSSYARWGPDGPVSRRPWMACGPSIWSRIDTTPSIGNTQLGINAMRRRNCWISFSKIWRRRWKMMWRIRDIRLKNKIGRWRTRVRKDRWRHKKISCFLDILLLRSRQKA